MTAALEKSCAQARQERVHRQYQLLSELDDLLFYNT